MWSLPYFNTLPPRQVAERKGTHALLQLLSGTLDDPLPPDQRLSLAQQRTGISRLLSELQDLDLLLGSRLDDTVDEDTGEVDVVRVESTDRNDFFGFDDGHLG